MELPKCEVHRCEAQVELQVVSKRTDFRVAEKHYCNEHAEAALDEIRRSHAWEDDAPLRTMDPCTVDIELVVCDRREDHSCNVFLRELAGGRWVSFETGRFEAWTLAWELKREPTVTLGTHRAMVSAFQALGATVTKVTINDVFEGGRYHAQVQMSQDGSFVVVNMRPTDALILAVICNVPIIVESTVWQKVLRPHH